MLERRINTLRQPVHAAASPVMRAASLQRQAHNLAASATCGSRSGGSRSGSAVVGSGSSSRGGGCRQQCDEGREGEGGVGGWGESL